MRWYWPLVAAAIAARLILVCFADSLNLGFRPEVATPLTSLRRLAEGYWLKQSSMSPYAGSMYHGSPLLLPIFGPLTVKRIDGQHGHLFCRCSYCYAHSCNGSETIVYEPSESAISEPSKTCKAFTGITRENNHFPVFGGFFEPWDFFSRGNVNAEDVASLIYLWNPMTIVTCVGSSTSPIDNLMVVLAIYGACSSLPPLAAFGWVMATHFSLYPAILILPVILLLGYGLDTPPRKLFLKRNSSASENNSSSQKNHELEMPGQATFSVHYFRWRPVMHFILWASIWACYVLFLSSISLKEHGGLSIMFEKTHGFILTVKDLSPNIGVLWYFFAEVFVFFRVFFLIVFNVNILFMILPLAIRLKHRPCFLAFVYITISSMLKSYPSIGDSALYLGLLGLFANELADMHFSFFLFYGYIGVSLLSAVMHNLWIWRGTGNANFYFATGIAYACLQIVLVVESVSTMLKHDRMLWKQSTS